MPEKNGGNSALLENYQALVRKVDSLCREIILSSGDAIACRKGCDLCCRHFSVFMVEAYAIAGAVANLEPDRAALVHDRAEKALNGDKCPLLEAGSCLLYDQRPIICRTHGLPIYIKDGETTTIDFCPMNFRNADSIEGRYIIDLDRLNDTLAAINSLFMKDKFSGTLPPDQRLTIAEAVLLRI